MSSQRTLSLTVRDFVPSDYERYVEILNAIYSDYPISVSEQRSRDDSIDKSKYLLKRFACIDETTHQILGFGSVQHALDMFHPRRFNVSIVVDPRHQGMGVGTATYERVSRELADLRTEIAWTMNKEDLAVQRKFFQKRGFHEKSRAWESRLDLSTFDESKFQRYLTSLADQGITFTTLSMVRADDETELRNLYELVQLIVADMPREATFTPLSFEQWKAINLNSPRILPEGYLIAKHDARYVGMSNVLSNEIDPQNLSQDDTGVRREYRGRGIAVALKLKVAEFAKKNGYKSIKTWNDSTNAPMLAVNTKLGFKRQVGWILLEKNLKSTS